VINGGTISGANTPTLQISSAALANGGNYDVFITNPCGGVNSPQASVSVICYANCDGSTAAPILNVADFSCFLNAYATGCT